MQPTAVSRLMILSPFLIGMTAVCGGSCAPAPEPDCQSEVEALIEQAEQSGQFLLEIENGSGDGQTMNRSNASSGTSVLLMRNERRTLAVDVDEPTRYELRLLYSNDGPDTEDQVLIGVRDETRTLTLADTRGNRCSGEGWNHFCSAGPAAPTIGLCRGENEITLTVSTADEFGVELDALLLFTVEGGLVECCDDGSPCSVAVDCDDGDPCTIDTCGDDGCCENTPACDSDADCDDGNACTADQCSVDGCCRNTPQCTTVADCDDGDPCTVDACGNSGCCEMTLGCSSDTDCDDGDMCTTDTCGIDGCCENTPNCETDTDCDDGDDGTTDTCRDDGCCDHICISEVACNDDDACTDDTCVDGLCQHTPIECVDDGVFCNGLESCDPATGQCASDGSPCAASQCCDEVSNACQASCCTQELTVSSVGALRSAIATAPVGACITVAADTYEVTETIDVARDDITIQGVGEDTFFMLAEGAKCPVFVLGEPTPFAPEITRRSITLRSMRIRGQRFADPSANELCTVFGREFLRNNGVTVRQAEDCVIQDVTLENMASGGIVLEQSCRGIEIIRVESLANEFDGVAWDGDIRDSLISGCALHDNDGAGISFDIGPADNLIVNNIIQDNAAVGIFIRDSDRNCFINCTIEGNGEDGVFIGENQGDSATDDAVDNAFISNHYLNNVRHGIWQSGMRNVGNCEKDGVFDRNDGEPIMESFSDEAPIIPCPDDDACTD